MTWSGTRHTDRTLHGSLGSSSTSTVAFCRVQNGPTQVAAAKRIRFRIDHGNSCDRSTSDTGHPSGRAELHLLAIKKPGRLPKHESICYACSSLKMW